MKNTSLFRRILSVALVIAMLGSFLVPVASAAPDKAVSNVEELTLTPMDPGALESQKLGQTPADDASTEMEDHALTDVVRVSIVLEKASTLDAGYSIENIAENAAAKAYREGLRADQDAMTAKIERAIGGKLDVQWNLTLAANNISANVLYGQIDAIKAVPGVKNVFLENRYEPQTEVEADEPNNGSAAYMIGSNIVWANGYTGAGSKVAVIDTGIDSEHLSFSGEALEYALRQNAEAKGISYDEYVASLNLLTPESIDAVKDQLNANIGSGAAAYRNTKIGYGYNYVDKRVDYIEHMQDSQGEHGSHVEGISAANRFVKVDGEFKPALEAVGTQGVAPDAQIVTMKVFGIGGGAYDSDYMVAIEDAIVLGCDSANLSLGSGAPGFGFSSGYEEVLNKLIANGMVCSISMGNAYGWYDTPYDTEMYPYLYADDASYDTGGSPGSFTNSLAVASVDNLGSTGYPLMFGDRVVFYSQTSGYGNEPINTIAGPEYDYVLLDGPGVDDNNHVGQAGDDFLALGREVLEGKVAMCYRGTSSFFAKANAAVAQGAVAVIIINNQAGVINMNLTGYNYTAPCVSILKADGDAIKADSQAVTDEAGNVLYYTGKMSVSPDMIVQQPEPTDTVTVSSFSSWGIPGTMVLKPEILAPGGNIYSVWGANKGDNSPTDSHVDYESMSGTSMAAPQVNGMAGLLGQYIRDNNLCEKTGLTQRQLINSLLMSTAHPVYDAEGNYWPVIRVGAGLANVGDAVSAQSYILMDEAATLFPDSAKDGKVKVELGDDPDYTGEFSYSFTIYPLEGKKDFTLRTDIFTQWLAGNGGYGMLQDQATVLLGSQAVYEINGQVYDDAYLIEADVNMDEVTDAADAQAILDHITGAEAEDAKFDAEVADVDGDGEITSLDAKLLLDSAKTPIISITEPTEVKVSVKVDEGDRDFLLGYFTNGFYIQGYTYVDPVADEEGAMDVTHSIPILGFCGSWTDPSMLDRSSTIDAAYGTGKRPYLANSNTNYLTLKDADGNSAIYMGNPYAIEDKFPADRLAMNSESTVYAYNYLNIRNVATLGFAITGEDGKVLLSQANPTSKYSAYYYVNGGAWQGYSPANYSVNKKLSAAGVAEGDKVTVGFYALPEYYAIQAAKLKGEVATSGSLDNEGFKAVLEAGLVGDGAGIKYDVTIDNTAPVVKGAFRDLISGDITVMATDENYIAYVGVLNKTGTKEYVGIVPTQDAAGQQVEVPLDLEGQKLPNEVTLLVADYAGNEAAFKVSLGGGEEEDNGGLMLGFTSANGSVGSGNRALQITPEELYYASASDFGGVAVYGNTNFKVDAAEYVDGYVFMAANDGWIYAAPLDALDEAEAVGKYSGTTEKIYDMAFNYKNNKLYALGMNNIIYQVDLITGKLTPIVVLTLNTTSGVYAAANTLAIDDEGTCYVANYGSTSSVKLFKFELPAEEEAEEPEVPANLVAGFYFDDEAAATEGWTFVDADGDGRNWSWNNNSSPYGANDSPSSIVSHSYLNGTALTPDNWAISPAVDLSERTNTKLSIYAQNYSSSYADTIAVYVGATTNPDEMIKLGDDLVPPGSAWTQYTFDLPEELANASEVYAAIRHYNCSDKFRVYVDSVEFLGDKTTTEEPEEPVVEPEPLAVDPIGTMGVWNYSLGGAMAWDHNADVLYFAGNYNATTDTDHNLFTVNTSTGRASKIGASGKTNPGRFYVCLSGLIIVPGKDAIIVPTDEPTELIVEPAELSLLRGQTVDLRINVMPWTLTDKSFTVESADPAIATVNDKGTVTGVAVGETKITVATVAEPVLTKEVKVIVEDAPEADLRGIIWDESGKGQAAHFSSNATSDWTAEAQVGAFRWGALVDDKVYGSTDDTMMYYDADTYEVTNLGGIVAQWIPSDAIAMPEDMVVAWGLEPGFRIGGLCNNGTYFEVLNPEAGNLNYWNLSTAFGSDPMAVIAIIGRGDYTVNGTEIPNGLRAVMITESGAIWNLTFNMEGSLYREDTGKKLALPLEGVSDPTNETWASLHYSQENDFLYLSLYNGADDYAHLYAIDYADPSRFAEVGTFKENVWPVVGLHEYVPATDLALSVNPTDLVLFEGETAEVNVKVKLGETNEYTAEVADPKIVSFEDGVVTALKEGETDITITTVDSNEAGEKLTETVHVKVKGYKSVDLFVHGQVTDANGARFTKISLDGAIPSKKGTDAPGDVTSGSRTGDIYFAGMGTSYNILDAETFQPTDTWNGVDSSYSQYPPMDVANYPNFLAEDSTIDNHKMLFTTSLGWLVTPDYYGWNMSSLIPDMAGICFGGTSQASDGTDLYIYYILGMDGTLYQMGVDYVGGRRTEPEAILDTGIALADQNDASMAFVASVKLGADGSVTGEYENAGIVIADNGTKKLWYLDFLAEDESDVVGLVGEMDVDNVSGLYGTYDALETVVDESELHDYYLVGTMNDWAIQEDYKLNNAGNGRYVLAEVALTAGAELKIKDGKLGDDEGWYPAGTDNNYVVEEDGNYSLEFYPNGTDDETFYEGYFKLTKILPPVEGEALFTDSFEDGIGSWTLVDADGDGFNFQIQTASQFQDDPGIYDGEAMLSSGSWDSTAGALTPDNWAISPAINLSEAADDAIVSVYARGIDPSYPSEVFAIYAGTSANPSEMTKIGGDFTATSAWTQYTAPLADFVGQETVYIALRHYNISDMFYLNLDYVQVLSGLTEGTGVAPAPVGHSYKPVSSYEAVPMAAARNTLGDGRAIASAVLAPASLEAVKMGETGNAANGGLNAVKVAADKLALEDETVLEEGVVTVALTESEDTANGVITVTYDPEKLTFDGCISGLELTSVNEKEGTICFAYASSEIIPAGSELAKLTFSYESDGIDTEITVKTLERNNDLGLEDEALVIPVKAEPHVHTYGEPVWNWAEDNKSATATFTCEKGDDEQIIEAVVTEEATPATCTEDGVTTFTATAVFQEETYTDVRTVAVDALGHTPAEAVEENRVEPTCHDAGHYDSVVYCSVCGAELSRETITLEKLEHVFGEPEWIWSEDNMEATAKFVCELCGDAEHVEAEVEMELIAPSCTEAGKNIFTATVEFQGEIFTDSVEEAVEALGHKPGEIVIENEVEATCTEAGSYDEVVYCQRCNEELSRNTVTVEALGHKPGEIVIENEVEATCTEKGGYDEVVYCTVCNQEISRNHVEIEATGHAYGEPEWTWSEDDLTNVTAKFVCANCGDEQVLNAETSFRDEQIKVFVDAIVEFEGQVYTDTREFAKWLFDDVQDPEADYFLPVYWAYYSDPQITNGVTETLFNPSKTVTRGQAVTFLWRAAGCPAPESTENPFTDVKEGKFYYDAVLWAVEQGITNGTTATTFSPNKSCSRGDILTFLYRAKGSPAVDDTIEVPFTDVKPGAYYYDAMLWALANGIDEGTSETTFAPKGDCSRGAIVTFLYRAEGCPDLGFPYWGELLKNEPAEG